ncbi:PP2C family protein-serine/threonine phosphatase [Pseudomonas oligotrophica]|uniref:PP2C family protein-serine/threonine phosphatase n=1 Tax=Pseudomonas oligotrophica TaxID=2912055 RepID=UPI001F24A271|nr:PP2C family serine/threonine-protein phosphatase [Pseudomonas oligotrophica]MCF7200503.1 serine/threonine-protein phosphatase [Pseudomonas oligotrophica]
MTALTTAWRSAGRSETGKVRPRNEDAFLDCPQQGLWAVADGMGGHRNGALASRLAVERLAELPDAGDLAARLLAVRQCLHRLNRQLSQALTITANCPEPIMGTTVVALLMEDDRAACVWAGDSRCYLWRRGRLYQLSRDHSLLQQLLDAGQLSPAQAAAHPGAHALTRAIGASEGLQLDVLEFSVQPGDALLLASDGLYQSLSPDALGAALSLPSAGLVLSRLFDAALDGPARDNLSAVVIRP